MKKHSESGFILPIVIGVVALGATVGLWYNVQQEKARTGEMTQIEQDAAELYVASQLGVSVNKISLVAGNSTYAKFEYKEGGNSIFAEKKTSLWKVVEPNDRGYSCEQLGVRGFTGKFLYDCETQYESESAVTLLTDTKDEAILLGFLQKIDDCAGCVTLTTNTQDTVMFVLDEDFDDGDYVAVNIPDDEIIAINDELQDDSEDQTQEEGEGAQEDDGNNGEEEQDEEVSQERSDENNGNEEAGAEEGESDSEDEGESDSEDQTSQEDDQDSEVDEEDETQEDEGATIVEEIVDAEDVDEDEGPGNSDDLDETESDDPADDSSDETSNPTEDEGGDEEEDSNEGEDPTDESDNEDDEDDDEEYENINFFDLDSSDQGIQVIGDPSEDRQ